MVKYEGRSGKEADLEQFSEAINIIRYPQFNTQKPQQDPFLLFIELFLFQSDDATWTQCLKWQWQWLS